MPKRRLEGRAYRVEYTRFDSDGNPCGEEPQEWSFVYVAKEFPELASIVAQDGFNKLEYEIEGERVFIQERECWRHEQGLRNEFWPRVKPDPIKVRLVVGDEGVIHHEEWLTVEDGDSIRLIGDIKWDVKHV